MNNLMRKMNNLGRGDWFLMFVLLVVGVAVFVSSLGWEGGAHSTNYTVVEAEVYYHNFSANITGFASDTNFTIDANTDISWTNASGTFLVSAASVSDWISITDALTGNLTINAKYDNQTGFFKIPIQATNTSVDADGSGSKETFEFIINATNDAPNFTSSGIADSYTFSVDQSTNFSLIGADEEDHFPLIYNVTFNDTCVHGVGTGLVDNTNCNLTALGLSLDYISNTTSNLSFTADATDVGTYWANISVMDAAVDYDCPHDYCDATYNTTNLTTYYSQMVLFTVSPTLTVDISNCTGVTLTEDVQFNCTIVITTPGEKDILNLSSDAYFNDYWDDPNNESWFFADNTTKASNFNYNVSISVNASKSDVGDYTINFSVVDTTANPEVSNYTLIDVYVNFIEFEVTLDSVSDLNGSTALYEDYSFDVNATDDDLLIRDKSVKAESLVFASNTSWVSVVKTPGADSGRNYSTTTVSIDHSVALALLDNIDGGNYTVKINVTDEAENSVERTFVIEIRNETAPEWDGSLGSPVNLTLIEGTLFTYNVSMNVSDDTAINFSYQNNSGEFCSLNSTTFNSTTGIINFTPTDCDVGYHNVTIIATDGNLDSSHGFNFTVQNIPDSPEINSLTNGTLEIANASTYNLSEGSELILELVIDDDDFLIPSGQEVPFYNESLTVDVVATNLSGVEVDLFEFSFVEYESPLSQSASYNLSFTPIGTQVDNYTIFINITDNSGTSISRTFYLNISETLNAPNLTLIDDQYFVIHDYVNFTVSATDDEDGRESLDLTYNISRINATAPNFTIGENTGFVTFDLDSNESYAGIWHYNVSVNDSDYQIDFQVFHVYIYGNATLVSPDLGGIFNLTENSNSFLNFTINHTVADNLTYEFWIDSITCSLGNSSDCDYGGPVLRESLSAFGDNTQYNWSFTANYTDETYGNLKNLSIKVYPNTTNINSTQRDSVATYFNFSLNVSHTNAPPVAYESIGSSSGTYGASSPISFNLLNNFRDYDYLDTYYQQEVTFTISSSASTSGIMAESYVVGNGLTWEGLIDSWSLQLYAMGALEESVTIMANDSSESVNLTAFTVTFTAPSPLLLLVPTSGGGGSKTKLKHYSLKLIVPQDVVISSENYIDIPFMIQNNGQVDLRGINLNSFVRYNNEFSDDVRISLADNYIEELKFGQSENFSMRIIANTQRSGRYKATILANVTTPKFSDWGEFFIDLRKTNESEAEQILIFTEKLVAENPECLELTELLNEAREFFALGEYSNSLRLATEATEACEDAIEANEQIKYPVAGFVKDNFYYISFSTLMIFLAGFIFYVYKRVRFNKYKVDDYI